MFDESYELPLDQELVKWYIKRKSDNISIERWAEYSLEISDRLCKNMSETMDFLEYCNDEELDGLLDEIGDLCESFTR